MDSRISRIISKINEKGFNMNPVLSVQEVENFEIRNKISLPSEYRDFLLHVGNGGDGPPYYGLYTLEEAFAESKGVNRESDDFLSDEFPLEEYWVWEAEENWSEELEKRHERVYNGVLFLGTEGCGEYWTLIISGPQRGQVWDITDVGACPCAPPLTFLEWYEYWLDGGKDYFRDFEEANI